MNRLSKLLGALSVFCLLSTHVSGLHLHVDEAGRNAGLHGTHMHHAHRADHDDLTYQESAAHRGDLHAHPSGDHNHAEESDVSLFEQVTSSPQSDQVSAAIEEALPAPVPAWVQIHTPATAGVFQDNKSCIHWRPPLRAPPHIS
jgi:hypothetical protein